MRPCPTPRNGRGTSISIEVCAFATRIRSAAELTNISCDNPAQRRKRPTVIDQGGSCMGVAISADTTFRLAWQRQRLAAAFYPTAPSGLPALPSHARRLRHSDRVADHRADRLAGLTLAAYFVQRYFSQRAFDRRNWRQWARRRDARRSGRELRCNSLAGSGSGGCGGPTTECRRLAAPRNHLGERKNARI